AQGASAEARAETRRARRETEARMKYFVMLRGHTDGIPRPICHDSEYNPRIRLFDSKEDADAAGRLSPLGAHYRFEIYHWDPQDAGVAPRDVSVVDDDEARVPPGGSN